MAMVTVYNERANLAIAIETFMGITGTPQTVLIVLRGNSASGKTSLAHSVRWRVGRGVAIVSQDVVRRDILWEHETPTGANIGMIEVMARYALDNGYHVIVEGILKAHAYGEMLDRLADHRGRTTWFYLDIPWDETVRRHASKPQAMEYGADLMRQWFKPLDLLPQVTEHRLDETLSLDQMTEMVLERSGLGPDPGGEPNHNEG